MLRRLLVLAVVSTAAVMGFASLAQADVAETSKMDFGVCTQGVTATSFTRGGPGGGPFGSCTIIFADNDFSGQASQPGFCLGEPISIYAHLQNQNGAGIGQDFVATVTGPGYSQTYAIDGPNPDSQWDVAQFPIATPTQTGTYSVTIVTEGTTYFQGPSPEPHVVAPDSGTGFFDVVRCGPPGKPGCGFGDKNHDHTGPPSPNDRYDPNRCPEQAGKGH